MNLNRRVPDGLPGGVRGRKFIIAFSYSIINKTQNKQKQTNNQDFKPKSNICVQIVV